MTAALTPDEFAQALRDVTRSALRLEQQPTYVVGYEDEDFAAYLRGEPRQPTRNSGMVAWLDQIRDQTGRGVRIERVRVHQDPPTDYQRWVRWVGDWNEEAGEIMHYTTPDRVAAVGLDAAGPDDWWLLDDAALIRMVYETPGVATSTLVTDPVRISEAREWWKLAMRAAT